MAGLAGRVLVSRGRHGRASRPWHGRDLETASRTISHGRAEHERHGSQQGADEMNQQHSRRDFLRTSGAAVAAGAAVTSVLRAPGAFAAQDSTVKIALVGCGGRGTGAAQQALSTAGPTKL